MSDCLSMYTVPESVCTPRATAVLAELTSTLTPPTMSEAALSRISNLIKVEDDLLKIDSLRQQFTKERNSVDAKLNATTQEQIDSIISNLERLNVSAQKLGDIKGNIQKIDIVYGESITQVKEYDTLRSVSGLYETMMQVQNLYKDIANFREYLGKVDAMIEGEMELISEDISYPMYDLPKIHFHVTQARNFLDYLTFESQMLSDDTQSLVTKITLPIKKTVRRFDQLLKEAIISITEAVKEGNTELIARVVKIVEFEAAEDAKVVLTNSLGLITEHKRKVLAYSKFRAGPRNYMKFFYSMLDESLAETFNKCVDHFADDKMLVYENLDWLEDELVFVVHTLAPLFPEQWGVADFIQSSYYELLHKFTMELINTNPPAEDLMQILAYDSRYNTFVGSLQVATGKNNKDQRSILGEELKASVLEDYMKVIITKMEEWNDNLMKQAAESFITRKEPPDVYAYRQTIEDFDEFDHVLEEEKIIDVYVLPDFKTSMSMFKEQADAAAESGYGKVLVGVIEHWSKCYNQRVAAYMRLVHEEMRKYMLVYSNEKYLIKDSKIKNMFKKSLNHNNSTEIDVENMTDEELANFSPPGLIEYLTALCNTYEINLDRLQDKFLPNYLDKVHATYHDRIQQAFNETITPSTDLNAQVVGVMKEIIINDLYPALSQVFTKEWYEGERTQTSSEPIMAETVVTTLAEYMGDLRGYASYDIFSLTFQIVLDLFVCRYIQIGYQNVLHGDGKKIDPHATKRSKSFSEAVNRDITILYDGLESLLSRKDAVMLLKSLTALEMLTTLATMENPFEYIPQMWEEEILEAYYDCSVEYVRGILLCRKDIDSKMVPALIEELEERKRKYHATVEPPLSPLVTLNGFTFA